MDEVLRGVDLNRNYDWDFGNGSGSAADPCNQAFRGPSPFSEAETIAMKDFVIGKSGELKAALNYHAYGNYFLHPFSSDTDMNTRFKTKYTREATIYKEIYREVSLPFGNM